MAAFAVDRDAQGISVRVVDAGSDSDLVRGKFIAHVESDAHRRFRKARKQAVLNHSSGAGYGLLGGLANQHQRAVPAGLAVHHDVGRPDENGHVHIVAARMHHRDIASRIVFGVNLARVGESGLLLDGKRVEFGAQHHRWPGAILENGDDARAADSFRDFIPQGAETSGEFRGGLRLVRGEFGILMKIDVEIVRRGINSIDFSGCCCRFTRVARCPGAASE